MPNKAPCGCLFFRHFDRRPRCHHPPALVTGSRSEIHDPVASRRDTHVVLDHDHGIAGFDEPIELGDEPFRCSLSLSDNFRT